MLAANSPEQAVIDRVAEIADLVTVALDELLQGRVLACDPRDQDRYGRVIAVCMIGAIDIGEWMVKNGWATAYRRYSTDYVPAEEKARAEGRGIWSGSFENPEAWRWGG